MSCNFVFVCSVSVAVCFLLIVVVCAQDFADLRTKILTRRERHFEDYYKLDESLLLGAGACSVVKVCRHLLTGEEYACKMIR
jgi:hypothetical protein